MILVIFFCVWEKIDNGKNSVSRKIGGSYVRLFIYLFIRRMQGELLMSFRFVDIMVLRMFYFKIVGIKLMVVCIRYVFLNGLCSYQEIY